MKRKVGLVINPIAGLGGTVGLKGTDGLSTEAREQGAVPKAGIRAEETLSLLRDDPLHFLTASGAMGADALTDCGMSDYTILYRCSDPTTAEDTIAACREIARAGAAIIIFAGGDGTARDVLSAVGQSLPILGIPAGVKMYSAVFATDPIAAAALIREAGTLPLRDAEVLDIDEEAYRNGLLTSRLYGIARTPFLRGFVQHAKETFYGYLDEDRERREIARFMAGVLASGRPFILGPGSTTGAVAEEMGLPKTLLGFDAYADGTLSLADLNERSLLAFLHDHEDTRLIISPIGAQGFVIGRGTQVVSPAALKQIGYEKIIIVATESKLRATPDLHIDSGDHALDCSFPQSVRVICGFGIAQRRKLLRSV
jgi:predicted polyphosphate/ATP-dependent NAD kinase